jgi:hypothetical protein
VSADAAVGNTDAVSSEIDGIAPDDVGANLLIIALFICSCFLHRNQWMLLQLPLSMQA